MAQSLRMNMVPRAKAIWWTCAGTGAGLLVLVLLFSAFSWCSVCSRCGTIQDSTEWQIPFTGVGLFRHSSQRSTPVSAALLGTGIVPPHEHGWLFCRGAGNGVKCALGPGEELWATVQTKTLADLLEATQRYGEAGFRDKLVRFMFEPDTSNSIREFALTRVPVEGFPTASALHSWIAEQSGYLDSAVIARKKP